MRVITILLISLLFATDAVRTSAQHAFPVKQYEAFHDVLHPLEHEALPKKDFKRIRTRSVILVNRGRAIVRVGVPPRIAEDKKQEFTKELKKFDQALKKFRTAARTGNNTQLQTSYSAVHDSFELLAGMLP
ncbi:MAG TPA: hypothetical protein VJM12_22205 [Pyrinomonadaceae bacterium]|nr:hypothetical protein [Pyrinomonadaceae bacterium]